MSDTHLQVLINQAPHTLPQGATLADAVALAGVQPPFAAAVNLQFVPRGQYAQHALANHDTIELISPITGG
jgi:sulfur carrier protein